ncbi:MAG: AlkA N-terminal domain-containing protein [Myxococcota bacterium]
MTLDPDRCYQAILARDARFDGRLFVGVTSTGVYCRPVCPATTPKPAHCRFFPSAAAAQAAGFRPCLRCRPETTHELGAWHGTSSVVSRALALIADGALDDAPLDALADRLGLGERHVRRLFQQHLGASPAAVARTRRVLFAKQLLHETSLPIGDVARAAGFRSVRQLDDTFRRLFGRPPSALRSRSRPNPDVTVLLRYRPPFDWDAALAHLAGRAVDGVERVEGGTWQRTVLLDGDRLGTVRVAHAPDRDALAATLTLPDLAALAPTVARIRRLFDLDADTEAIGAHLAQDPLLAPLVARRPGLRVPGGWDGFELAARAILGQQVTVAAARGLAGQLVRCCSAPAGAFPGPRHVLAADLAPMRMPGARKRALHALAEAAAADPHLFRARATVDDTVARLRALPGVGEWTAQYVALRAVREPDAFPAGDVALQRRAGLDAAQLLARAERWRPWRAYAAQHLWSSELP